ncbi:MAG: hypothetical protein ACREJ3_14945 [Polyangiaceae bacterium]
MKASGKNTWSNQLLGGSNVFRASSGLLNAVREIVAPLEGVQEIRVLHRDRATSKFFVIMNSASLETVDRVVGAMVQIKGSISRFDYDTVPAERVAMVPPEAVFIGHD